MEAVICSHNGALSKTQVIMTRPGTPPKPPNPTAPPKPKAAPLPLVAAAVAAPSASAALNGLLLGWPHEKTGKVPAQPHSHGCRPHTD